MIALVGNPVIVVLKPFKKNQLPVVPAGIVSQV